MGSIDIKDYLPLVRRPSRYIGGEVNSVRKDLSKVAVKFGLGFPDLYDVGMSHLGIQILYQVLNSRDDVACERVFAPWADMEELLRELDAPLATLESGIPLSKLDIMGFSLQYELSYTNVLNMLELGGIPRRASERGADDPYVIGGGPAAFNPEPVAEFFDAFLLGDGEEAVLEITDAVAAGRAAGEDRESVLERLARIEGVYVPSFFKVSYNDDGTVRWITPLLEGYERVDKRTTPDMNAVALPTRPVVPFTETIHDRLTVEISRGCTRGCRFCQAGMIYRPVREKTPETIINTIEQALDRTGYDEVSLLSLSTGDYTLIEELLPALMGRFADEKVAVSLPSLRVGTLSPELAEQIKRVRKTGFTLAPEAGSERLRLLINKGIKEEDLLAAARDVFTLGWKSIKLYFMIGLPTETDDDILEIVRLAECLKRIGKQVTGGRAPQINVAAATFIPKPFTPFQWEPQIRMDEAVRKQALLKKRLGGQKIGFKWHDPEMSLLEGVFARGDRRLAPVVEKAFELGCRFDGWGEEFSFKLWNEAFEACGVDPEHYVYRRMEASEVLAWDHLNTATRKRFLIKEYNSAIELARTPDCKVDRCTNCGICDHKEIKNRDVVGQKVPEMRASGLDGSDGGYKVTLRYTKTGDMRFLGHLELVKAITRGVKRAHLPLKYSQGFHPLPKMSFSPPIPVGLESMDEHVTMEFGGDLGHLTPAEVASRLNATMPEGIKFTGLARSPLQVSAPSAIISKAEYLIFLKNGPLGLDIDPEGIDGLIRDFKEKSSVVTRIQKGKKTIDVDLKTVVEDIVCTGGDTLRLRLDTSGVSVRPHDVVACLLHISSRDASLIPVLKTGPFGSTPV